MHLVGLYKYFCIFQAAYSKNANWKIKYAGRQISRHSPNLLCPIFCHARNFYQSVSFKIHYLKFATFSNNLLSLSCDRTLPHIFLHNCLSQPLYSITIDYHYTLALYTIIRASKLAVCRVPGAETTMFTEMFTELFVTRDVVGQYGLLHACRYSCEVNCCYMSCNKCLYYF